MRARAAALAGLLVIAGGAAAWRDRARLRHVAVPVLADPSVEPAPGVAPGTLPPCAAQEAARAGRRITALLRGSDGALWIATFDDGIVRVEPGGVPRPVPGLEGRERFVNGLAEGDGLVWAATQGGLLALDEGRRVATLLAGDAVAALASAGSRLYAGSARGLFLVSAAAGAEPLGVAGPQGEPLHPTALAAAGGRLWIGTASGAYSVPLAALGDPRVGATAAWHPLVFGEPPADTNVVTALAPLAGSVVAGTDDGGLALVRADGRVSALRFSEARANAVVPGAAADAGGAVLLGTQGGGLLVARVRGGALEAGRPAGLEAAEVSAVWSSGGEVLVGTADGAVFRMACPPAGPP